VQPKRITAAQAFPLAQQPTIKPEVPEFMRTPRAGLGAPGGFAGFPKSTSQVLAGQRAQAMGRTLTDERVSRSVGAVAVSYLSGTTDVATAARQIAQTIAAMPQPDQIRAWQTAITQAGTATETDAQYQVAEPKPGESTRERRIALVQQLESMQAAAGKPTPGAIRPGVVPAPSGEVAPTGPMAQTLPNVVKEVAVDIKPDEAGRMQMRSYVVNLLKHPRFRVWLGDAVSGMRRRNMNEQAMIRSLADQIIPLLVSVAKGTGPRDIKITAQGRTEVPRDIPTVFGEMLESRLREMIRPIMKPASE